MSIKNTSENATRTFSTDYSTQLALETGYIVRKIVKIVYSKRAIQYLCQLYADFGENLRLRKRKQNFIFNPYGARQLKTINVKVILKLNK